MSFFTEGHENSDVDTSSFAQHHTLGSEENQAAPGASTNSGLTNGITSKRAVQAGNVNITTTGNTDLVTENVSVADASDVFLVTVDTDVRKNTTANDILSLELMVDGVAQTPTIVFRLLTTNVRTTGGRAFLITGLTAGSLVFKVRARLDIAGDYTVSSTALTVLKLNNLKGGSIAS